VHKSYLGHIRTLIEPAFTFAKNPVIRYLREEWDVRLMIHPQPEIILEVPPGFQLQMSLDMLQFLRQEVEIDMELAGPIPPPVVRKEESPLLVVDYETFLLQLGREGYFFTLDGIKDLMF